MSVWINRCHIGDCRELPGMPGYAVTADGKVWSRRQVSRSARTGRFESSLSDEWTELTPHLRKGYPSVAPCVDGKNREVAVHKLVLLAFVGPAPQGYEACHDDGVRTNCALANLRWDTRKANHADKRRHGTNGAGERNAAAKLSDAQVAEIRRRKEGGERNVDLAAQFGVHPVHISNICRGVCRG